MIDYTALQSNAQCEYFIAAVVFNSNESRQYSVIISDHKLTHKYSIKVRYGYIIIIESSPKR